MTGMQRRRPSGLCAALAVTGWMGFCPAGTVAAGADPVVAGAGALTVEALEARVQALPNDHEEQSPVKPELRQIEAGFIKLLESQPDAPRLLADLAGFYALWGDVLESASPAALRFVAESADPIQLAWRLHRRARDVGADLLLAALSRRPDRPDVWLEVAGYAENPAWKIVATEEAARLLARRAEPASQRLAAAITESALDLDFEYGQLDRAAAMLAGLPAAVRAEVESGAAGNVKLTLAGADLEGNLEDSRLDLALLSLARGDLPGADRWLAAVRPGTPAAASGGSRVHPDSAWHRVLEAWRLPPDDVFEVLTRLVQVGGSLGARNLAPAAVARRGGYPVLEKYFNAAALVHLLDLTPPAAERKLAPPGVAAAATALEAQIVELRTRITGDWVRSADEARAALGPDPAAPTVERLLRAPRLTPFEERPVPAGLAAPAPTANVWRSADAWLPPDLARRFQVVRGEQQGRQMVVIAKSLDFGGATYWVILSSDGGATWSKPLYGGVELAHDYLVHEASDLPLLAGDHLHVEVERQDAAKRDAANGDIYLDIPIATLARDSDGDGLTDLAEERLITDPADPDTDHDGVADGVDMLPHVAAQSSPESRVFAVLFHGMQWDERFGWQEALDARTEYWIADRQLFTALDLCTRFVVLTPEELDLAEEKLGHIFARQIELFVVDHAGRRAFAIWTSQVMGETYRLAQGDDGSWQVDLVDSWNY